MGADRPASRTRRGTGKARKSDLADSGAVGPQEGDALIARALEAFADQGGTTGSLAVAVSGGGDSLALLHLLAGFAKRHGKMVPKLHVLTVDHGLRDDSADEARRVAAMARFAGLSHTTLVWSGTKPKTGIQEVARQARYRLMGEFVRGQGIDALFVAHTADDQAETVLMRLARGSGVDGLSGMSLVSRKDDLVVLRPLLGVAKSRLIATLETAGTSWIEDPSNENLAFERIRWRAALPRLAELGLSTDALALSARRLQRARTALRSMSRSMLADPNVFTGFEIGFCRFPLDIWRMSAEEFRIRTLATLLEAIGGQVEQVSMAGVEALAERLSGVSPRGATMAQCALSVAGGEVTVVREEGRTGLPEIELRPGMDAIWDNRFAVSLRRGSKSPVIVRALGRDGLKQVQDEGRRVPGFPAQALRTVPSFWRGGALVAVPTIVHTFTEDERGRFKPAVDALVGEGRAQFIGLECAKR